MTLQECYEKLNGDYDEVFGRFQMEKMIKKFIGMFLNEKTVDKLREAIAAGDIENSFLAAHTLKGLAANLGFSELQQAASELTEQLRPRTSAADPELVAKVEASYKLVIATLEEYFSQEGQ